MPRCPDCNKFVSIDMAEPELDLELGDGEVTGSVRLVQTCAECGTELAETTLEIAQLFKYKHAQDDCDGNLLLRDEGADCDDRYEGQGRGAKHCYVVNFIVCVTCDKCYVTEWVDIYAEEPVSSFVSLV